MTGRNQLLVAGGVAVAAAAVYLAIAASQRGSQPAAPTAGSAAPAAPAPTTSRAPRNAAPAVPVLATGSAAPPAAEPSEPSIAIADDPAQLASAGDERAVADWIAQRKNEWVTACWPAPAPDRDPPEPIDVRLRAVFEADGKVRAHAFSTEAMADVARCLNQRPFDPPFAGRGQRVDLGFTFRFP